MGCSTQACPVLSDVDRVWLARPRVGLQVLPEEEGVFEIEAATKEAAERCKNEILALVEEPEVGKVYT